jgi:hypothetical protein
LFAAIACIHVRYHAMKFTIGCTESGIEPGEEFLDIAQATSRMIIMALRSMETSDTT